MKHLKISCQKHKIDSLLLSSRCMTNCMKICSFLHAHLIELMKVVENLFKKKLMVKNSFIEKTYVVGTHWIMRQFQCVPTTYVTENKEKNYLERTSDGGNGNHSVWLPIILIKIKVDQMLSSSYISSLLVSILRFCILFPISINVRLYFGAELVTFRIIHIGNRKIFLKHHSPPSPN